MKATQFIMRNRHLKSLSFTDESVSREAILADICGINPNKRILSYTSNDRPKNDGSDIGINLISPNRLSRMASLKNRKIPTSPENILDAPGLLDDFYLNVLSWSKKNVVAIGLDKIVYLWNADNEEITILNHNANEDVNSVSWASDGESLAVGTGDGKTMLYDVTRNEKVRTMPGQEDGVGALSWNKHILSCGANKTIFDRDVRIAKPTVRELYGHIGPVCGLNWSPDGHMLASGGADNLVNLWDSRLVKSTFKIEIHSSAVKALSWCPWKRNTLATGGGKDDKKIQFWNSVTGTRTHTIQCDSPVTSLHWSKHFQQIVSTHGDPQNNIAVWDYPSLDRVQDIPAHDNRILHSHLSPDGQVLATTSPDENLKFWRIFDSTNQPELRSTAIVKAKKKPIAYIR